MKHLLHPPTATGLALLGTVAAWALAAPVSAEPSDPGDDFEPPTVSLTAAGTVDGWAAGPFTAKVQLSDSGGSGPAIGEWTLTGATEASGSISGATVTSIEVGGAGRSTLTVVAEDRAGNSATQSFELGVDTTAPTVTLGRLLTELNGNTVPPGTWTTAEYSCSDAESGIASCTADLASGTRFDTSTRRDLLITAVDKVGRTSTTTVTWDVGDLSWTLNTPLDITPPGDAVVGRALVAPSPDISPQPDVLHHQWTRDGQPISGATAASYTPTDEDAGHRVGYVVRPAKQGYAETAFESATRLVVRPAVVLDGSGFALPSSARVGEALRPDWGGATFTPTATLSYQWTSNGAPIAGATAPTYVVAPADTGRQIGLVVTATAPGHVSWQQTAQLAGVVTATTSRTVVRAKRLPRRAVRLVARVDATGVLAPSGLVVVRERGRVLRTVRLTRGVATVRLPKRTRGRHTYTVTYRGTTGVAGSSARVTVRVR